MQTEHLASKGHKVIIASVNELYTNQCGYTEDSNKKFVKCIYLDLFYSEKCTLLWQNFLAKILILM